MRGLRYFPVLALAFLSLPVLSAGQAQQPQSSGQNTPAFPSIGAESSNKRKGSSRHQHDFLIKGTVFTPEGLSFAGARVRIRKTGEKSFRWHDTANSRGEFAIRVIQGTQYEVVVDGKGFKEQEKQVDAAGSERIEEIVFRMEREGSKPS